MPDGLTWIGEHSYEARDHSVPRMRDGISLKAARGVEAEDFWTGRRNRTQRCGLRGRVPQVWLVQQQVIVLRSGLTSRTAHTETSPADHEATAEAVADGNGGLAGRLMETHLALVESELLQTMHAAQSDSDREQAPGPRNTERTAP
ncbi:hypothetical protein [Streptomyces sp. NPDC056721]|uniref:hypothetical protein n=1 Tax=unclassified Streptomyces TaxID=2593676 RepID=UPI0036C48B59